MKSLLPSSLLLLAASLGSLAIASQPSQDEGPNETQEEPLRRRHPQTNLLFDLPDSFDLATDWRGYFHAFTESSILISESDQRSYDNLKKAFFDPKQLKRMNRKVESREDCTLNGLPGVKVEFSSEREGSLASSWAVIFGDEDGSVMVLGTAFKKAGEEEAAVVKHAVETVLWDRPEKIDPFDHVDYTLDVKVLRILKFAMKAEGMVMFTFGGSVDTTDNPGRPALIVQQIDEKVETDKEREELLRAQLATAPNLRDFKVDSVKEIEIDGLKGYEGWASGISTTHKDLSQNDMAVTVLQVTLFDEDCFYSFSGIIGTLISKNWLQMYQAGIHSFERKKAPVDPEKEGEETPEPAPVPPKENGEKKGGEKKKGEDKKQGD